MTGSSPRAATGAPASTSLALQYPGRLLGIHLVSPLAPPDRDVGDLTDRERVALADLDERSRTGSGYSAEHGTRPQTIGYSLTDSPVGLCAWIMEKIWAWTDRPGDLSATEPVSESLLSRLSRAKVRVSQFQAG